MSESVIICAIICITIVVVIWIGSSFLSLLSRIMKVDIEQKSEDVSDNIMVMEIVSPAVPGLPHNSNLLKNKRKENKNGS